MTDTSPRKVAETTQQLDDRRRAGFARRHWSTAAPFVALVVLVAFFGTTTSQFLTKTNGLNILSQSSVLLVIAVAATFPILMGSIDLSVGAVLTLSASMCAYLAQDWGPVAFLLAPVVGLVCGAVNGVLISYVRLPSFLVTLGTMFAFNGVAALITDGQPVSIAQSELTTWVSGSVLWGIPNVALWSLLVFLLAVAFGRYTRHGRYMYAIGGNELTARLSGVPVDRTKVYAFCITGLLAGCAGILQAYRLSSSTPNLGDAFLLLGIAAVVMGGTPLSGGVGGPVRAIIGVLIIEILSDGMIIASVQTFVQNIVLGVVVILAVAVTLDRKKLDLVK